MRLIGCFLFCHHLCLECHLLKIARECEHRQPDMLRYTEGIVKSGVTYLLVAYAHSLLCDKHYQMSIAMVS